MTEEERRRARRNLNPTPEAEFGSRQFIPEDQIPRIQLEAAVALKAQAAEIARLREVLEKVVESGIFPCLIDEGQHRDAKELLLTIETALAREPDIGTTEEEKPGVQLFKKDVLLKLDHHSLAGLKTVAGIRTTMIDIGDGHKTAIVGGSGIFKDETTEALVRALFFDGQEEVWQIVIPEFGTVDGPFLVTTLEYMGTSPGGERFEIGLEAVRDVSVTLTTPHKGERIDATGT